MAEEGHLALPRARAFGVVDDADEHQRSPGSGGRRPGHEHGEEAVDVDPPAKEEDDRRSEQRVLDRLRRGDQVPGRKLDRAPEARQDEEPQQGAHDQPERAGPGERLPAEQHPGSERRGDRGGDREVGSVDVEQPEVHVRLIPDVEEDERDRGGRDEREDVRCAQAGGQGGQLYWLLRALPSHLAPLGDGDRDVRRDRPRVPHDGGRDS
jgi:hypothetical protein